MNYKTLGFDMLPAPECIDWMFETTAWWLGNFGTAHELRERTRLVTPTPDHFPDCDGRGLERARAMFDHVVRYADLRDWNFEVVVDDALDLGNPMPQVPHPGFPKALLQREDRSEPIPAGKPLPVIVSPDDLDDPNAMIANMARDLSHYLLGNATTTSPGGDELQSCTVDLGAVLLGFGLFLANTAFAFEAHHDGHLIGWSSRHNSPLGEDALGYALALFARLTETPDRQVKKHLKSNPKAAFRAGCKDISKRRSSQFEHLLTVGSHTAASGPYR